MQQLSGTVSISSLSGKGTQVTICLPLQGDSPSNRIQIKQTDSEDRLSAFEPAENCLDALRKVAQEKTIGLHQREISKSDRTSGEKMVLDYVELYLTQWYGLRVTKFSAWTGAPEVDLIVAIEDEQDQSFNWSDQSATGKLPPVLLVTDRYFGQKGTRNLPSGVFGYYTRPVGPYKFAKCLLACFEKLKWSNLDSNGGRHEDNDTKQSLDKDSGQDAASTASHKQQGVLSNNESHKTSVMESHGSGKPPTPTKQPSTPIGGSIRKDSNEVWINDKDDAQDTLHKRRPRSNLPSEEKSPSTPSDPAGTTDSSPIQQRPLRILLVEDNEINLQLLHRFLAKRKGDTINVARNGYEAVAAVQETPEPHDVIFMDISMPGIDGFEATRQIRRYEGESRAWALAETPSQSETQLVPGRKQQAYIVALTGLGAGRDRDEASKSGFDEFLTKPIPFQKVGRMLNERSSHLGKP